MIKNHQNFKENNKTATFVENVSSNKFTQPRDREARPRRQNGQVSKNHFNTASQGGWRIKTNSAAEIPRRQKKPQIFTKSKKTSQKF